ncbi:hypothetical protein C0Q70_01978 [Pomacea canaliculata]|uniref:G-protein coupled receptors family 1 profile domain-containing protein n=1 Tax=Pomacea canaliculata TaxID=400727 RepID=A0A2T7Q109_POMCA|nr:hypothetical protein C0Q70_01978 [Pomacea canaliculata]
MRHLGECSEGHPPGHHATSFLLNFDGVGGMSGGTNNRNEPALGRIVASAELEDSYVQEAAEVCERVCGEPGVGRCSDVHRKLPALRLQLLRGHRLSVNPHLHFLPLTARSSPPAACQVYSFLGGVTGFVSINTLTAMACDRYSAIFRRHGVARSDSATCSRSLGLLISVWIYSIFWSVPPFFGWGQFALDGGRVSCCFDYLTRSASNVSYIVAIFIFCFAIQKDQRQIRDSSEERLQLTSTRKDELSKLYKIPRGWFQMAVIIFCYVSMVAAFVQRKGDLMGGDFTAGSPQSRSGGHHEMFASLTLRSSASSASSAIFSVTSTPSRVKRRRLELRVTRLVCCITMSFCFSWLPFAVVALIGTFGNPNQITPMVSTLPGMLAKTSTVVNPLIYAIGHPHYRRVLQKNWRRARGHGTDRGWGKDCCGSNPKTYKRRASPNLQGTLPSSYFATVMVKTDSDGNVDIHAGGR